MGTLERVYGYDYKKNWNRFIPRQPMRYYKNKGWTNWDDFLGRK